MQCKRGHLVRGGLFLFAVEQVGGGIDAISVNQIIICSVALSRGIKSSEIPKRD